MAWAKDRFYKGAIGLAPRKCFCGRTLPKPIHGNPLHERQGEGWYVTCACHRVYAWSFHETLGSVWKERHELPLFDTRKVIPDHFKGEGYG